MKRLKKRILPVLCLALALCLSPAAVAEAPARDAAAFSDVAEDAWYAASIAAMTARGLLDGMPGDRFSPEAPMTRAMLVTVLYRLAGKPEARQSPFSDVAGDAWYAPAVRWALEAGITEGVAPDRFAPDRPCAVQEASVFLYRYARCSGYPDAVPDFSGSGVSPWAAEAVAWAGLIGLTPSDAVPTDEVTRGAFAAMLDAYCQFAEPIPDRAEPAAVSAPEPGAELWNAPGADSGAPGAAPDIPGAGADVPGAGADIPDVYSDFSDETQSGDSGDREITGSDVVAYAMQFVGNSYAWGGNSLTEGIDAAGFVVRVYEHFGIDLWGSRNSQALRSVGIGVDTDSMQAGDIVCYSGHVAIYTGGGTIVEAQSSQNGITSNRSVLCAPFVAIRRVIN